VRETRRYLGLELAGAKNQKTALAALEFYPKEKKIFLLDTFDRIAVRENQTSDEALLEVLEELKPGVARMGVNIPLTLPPCVTCTRNSCPMPSKCTVPSVKWMREMTRKATKGHRSQAVGKQFTPYTQRPVELWIRYSVLDELNESSRFEIDEALGGNKAPLTVRMNFLKRQLTEFSLIEVWPKLTVAILGEELGLNKRVLSTYRHLEQGAHARSEFLETLARKRDVFIYERDLRKLSSNLASFDAFVCAYTALLMDLGQCAKAPAGFPVASGWVEYPRLAAARS
jgi:hypothetical protein